MPTERVFRTPGQLIQALLEERGWTQAVLATVLDMSPTIVNRIVNDQRSINAKTALVLGETFGVSPKSFLILQGRYDLAKARIETVPDPRRAVRAQLYNDLPMKEMVRRGWLPVEDLSDLDKIEATLAAFFGVEEAEEIEILPHAAKKTEIAGGATPAQLVWLYRVRQIARGMVVPRYTTRAMQGAVKRLGDLLASAEETRHAPRILAEAGVRFIVVESLNSAHIDGVCFWLDERSPVIGLSMRHDRIDNFWFVLRHECEHVLRGHGRSAAALDTELEGERAGTGSDIPEEERIANEAAADFCVPGKLLSQFIARKAPIFTERDLLSFAKLVNVHPGLVAGQIQHATERYDRFRKHLARVRSVVLPNVMHDGWGDVAPIVP